MKIKITYEKVFDSFEFYDGLDAEELAEITINDFKSDLIDYLYEDEFLDYAVLTPIES